MAALSAKAQAGSLRAVDCLLLSDQDARAIVQQLLHSHMDVFKRIDKYIVYSDDAAGGKALQHGKDADSEQAPNYWPAERAAAEERGRRPRRRPLWFRAKVASTLGYAAMTRALCPVYKQNNVQYFTDNKAVANIMHRLDDFAKVEGRHVWLWLLRNKGAHALIQDCLMRVSGPRTCFLSLSCQILAFFPQPQAPA